VLWFKESRHGKAVGAQVVEVKPDTRHDKEYSLSLFSAV
jgi:hypothetical protein